MNRTQKLTLIAISTVVVVSILGLASFSLARLGYTSACDGCHGTSGVLTLTSNATGTVDATLGVTFTLVVDSDGYSGSDNLYCISLQSGWADNDDFTFTASEVQDGDTEDTNSNQNEITATFQFTPLSTGSFTINIWAAAAGDLATLLEVSVDVSILDTTDPTIDSPPDRQIPMGDPTKSITWNPFDANPNRYEIHDNATLMRSGAWDESAGGEQVLFRQGWGGALLLRAEAHTGGTRRRSRAVHDAARRERVLGALRPLRVA